MSKIKNLLAGLAGAVTIVTGLALHLLKKY